MTYQTKTITAAFRELLARIELNPARSFLASQRYNAIKHRIESELSGTEVLQVGSFQRKTKIRPVKEDDPLDIDVIVCFGNAYHYALDGSGNTPTKALEIVRRALVSDGTYRIMSPETDAPTVVLEYADGFKAELVPCYRDFTGAYPRSQGPACYIIGTSDGRWLAADYDFDAAFISSLNQNSIVKQSLIPSIKMVKAFLRGKNFRLKSFHTEILCAALLPYALEDWQAQNLRWDYQHILAQFLSEAYSLLDAPISIPGSYSPSVDSGMNPSELQELGQVLLKWGAAAWEICRIDDDGRAVEYWRDFFGDPFPT